MRLAGELADRASRATEVVLVVGRRPVERVALVAGGAEVQRAVGGHGVDRLSDRAVLERALVVVDDVVGDHVAAGVEAQRADVVGELGVAGEGGGEPELRARRHVVDDLEHRRALVAVALLAGEHVDVGGQLARGLRGAERVDAVREDAHLDAGAGDAVAREDRVHAVRRDALGDDGRGGPPHGLGVLPALLLARDLAADAHRRRSRGGVDALDPAPARDRADRRRGTVAGSRRCATRRGGRWRRA